MKTETIQQFLDRGGKITKVPTRHVPAKRRQAQPKVDLNLSCAPESLKIALGIK